MNKEDHVMSEQETDLLQRSTMKQKDEETADHTTTTKVSFLDTLKSSIHDQDINYVTKGLENINFQDEQENPLNHPNFIPLSLTDKLRLYSPWQHLIIIKLVGKRMGYLYLQNRLQNLWLLSEKISFIDLGKDYYLIKLTNSEKL